METDHTDLKIMQLRKLLESKDYFGDVHVNGIEQGSVCQVIKSCIALRKQSEHHEFRDPIVLTHFSYNEDKTRYLTAKFSIELDHPTSYRVRRVTFECFDLNHNGLGRMVRIIPNHFEILPKEKARWMVTPKEEREKIKKHKGPKL